MVGAEIGLTKTGVMLIHRHIKDSDILCLGYPDILSAPPKIILAPRERSERHGGGKKYDADEFFTALGARSTTYVDIDEFYGKEIVIDLNYPHNLGKFDLVIDPGTLEHCWNVAQAWENAFNAVKLGGHIYHNNPVNMVNHGFWNMSPTVYHDLYTQNGWESQIIINIDGSDFTLTNAIQRIEGSGRMLSHVIAKRTNESRLIYPTQSKYL